MNITKRLSFSFLSILFSSFFFINQVKAADTINVTAGSTQTINILANPPGTEYSAANLQLSVKGMTIKSFVAPTDAAWVIKLGDCTPNGAIYTTTKICINLGKSGNIKPNESLGILTVTFPDSGVATLSRDPDNAYSDGNKISKDVGELAKFNVTTDLTSDTSSDQSGGNVATNVKKIDSSTIAVIIGEPVVPSAVITTDGASDNQSTIKINVDNSSALTSTLPLLIGIGAIVAALTIVLIVVIRKSKKELSQDITNTQATSSLVDDKKTGF